VNLWEIMALLEYICPANRNVFRNLRDLKNPKTWAGRGMLGDEFKAKTKKIEGELWELLRCRGDADSQP
jgi:hypothetical protein